MRISLPVELLPGDSVSINSILLDGARVGFANVPVVGMMPMATGCRTSGEIANRYNPNSADSDNDGIPDILEVPNPNNLTDFDVDGVLNVEDADPQNADVNWPRAEEGGYILIDVEGPGLLTVRDLNDKGEVLFDEGSGHGETR